MLVYGRTTYEIMVPYWPDIAKNPAGETKADVEYAKAFDAVIAGKGKRLMDGIGMQEKLGLKLDDTKIFKSGSVMLHYVNL
jgi:hypothetical protein